jgi:hypothetical protein
MATLDTRIAGGRGRRPAAIDPRDQKIEMLNLRNAELGRQVNAILRALRRIHHRLNQLEKPSAGPAGG